MAFSFIHTGDLHLDSPLSGLRRLDDPRVEDIAVAPRRALAKLVEIAIEREVDAFLIAGDLWDGDWRDISAGLFVQEQAGRLRDKGIGVFAILGNHDAASQVTDRIRNIDAIHLFGTDAPSSVPCGEAVIHGMSYPQREVLDNIAIGYPQAVPGRVNIGLLHTSLDGRPGHAPYAPCKESELAAKGYHYFALGHIHAREIVRQAPASEGGTIAYCGVLQGRHARETGTKGAFFGAADGDKVHLTPIDLGFAAWFEAVADMSEHDSARGAMKAALEDVAAKATSAIAAVRVRLVGESAEHHLLQARQGVLLEEARFIASGLDAERLFIETVRVATSPRSGETARLPGRFETFLQEAARDEALKALALQELRAMIGALQDDETRGALMEAMPELAALEEAGEVSALLGDASERVLARLALSDD